MGLRRCTRRSILVVAVVVVAIVSAVPVASAVAAPVGAFACVAPAPPGAAAPPVSGGFHALTRLMWQYESPDTSPAFCCGSMRRSGDASKVIGWGGSSTMFTDVGRRG